MLRFPFAAALVAALAAPVPAAAELLVAPTRVVLTPETRSTELVLVNKGAETAAFRIAIENRRMNEDGSLEDAPTPQDGELFADDKLRYSPRQLVLEPGARQVVRIMATAPAGLAPGEYRSHLRLMSAPVSAGTAAIAGEGPADNSLAIELVAIRSITIPVILRVGALEASVTMDSAAISDEAPDQLVVRLTRSGTRSTYGDVSFTPEGAKEPVWVVRGVAIYVPNTQRDVIIPLPPEVRSQLASKKVRIDYVSTDAAYSAANRRPSGRARRQTGSPSPSPSRAARSLSPPPHCCRARAAIACRLQTFAATSPSTSPTPRSVSALFSPPPPRCRC